MKLRNKKTGEVREVAPITIGGFRSLAELNEEWEDATEENKPWEEVAFAKWMIGDLKIASEDYYEILPDGTKKTEFTWDEAMEIEKKTDGKWRLPTSAEWTAIVAAFGCDKNGNFDGELFAKTLNLTTDGGWRGSFWSRTTYGTTVARGLYFGCTYVNPLNNYGKVNGFTVRLVRGGEE